MPHKLERRLAELERKAPETFGTPLVIYHVISPPHPSIVQSRLVYVPDGAPIEITEAEEDALSELAKVNNLTVRMMIERLRALN